jgi:hypothetical protein
VRAYALENPAFPHDKTLNQFFGEAQFESYRALGSFAVMELGRKAGFAATSKAQKPTCLTQFFKGARKGLARSRAARGDRSPARMWQCAADKVFEGRTERGGHPLTRPP